MKSLKKLISKPEIATEPIVGYRVWMLEMGKLWSCAHKFEWPYRKAMRVDAIQSKGIHAMKEGSCATTLFREYGAQVAGAVYLWGKVQKCTEGYLAEFAYPKELWMPEDTDPTVVMKLEENYGVPVTLRREFRKPNLNDQQLAVPSVANPAGIGGGFGWAQNAMQAQMVTGLMQSNVQYWAGTVGTNVLKTGDYPFGNK